MGMDVYGRKPENKTGEYVRYSIWTWPPLVEYILERAPDEFTRRCKHWHSNDGDGLGGEDSRKLAEFLTREIDSGRAQEYVAMRDATLESLQDVPCYGCQGSGLLGEGKCHICEGSGQVRPSETYYHLDLEGIVRFRDFLRFCGGFNIH